MSLLLAILAFFGWTLTGPAYTVDGDTLRVAGVAVRLEGVDAEEMDEPNGPAASLLRAQRRAQLQSRGRRVLRTRG
jgi:endonuclease YncB( thermonuclease family)